MENNFLLAIFVLLAASVVLVPLAKIAGLGTILGYLAAGILIGPYGLGLVTDSEAIHLAADLGVVMMLFLIGLEIQPRELWRLRHHMLGLGLTQLLATAVLLAAVLLAVGFDWRAAVIAGLALAMSSTAIAMQTVAQRSIVKTDTGRGGLAILLVQDVAVIPILAAIPLLAGLGLGAPDAIGEELVQVVENPFDWWVALAIVGGFAAAIAASRFLVRPVMHFVALSGAREAFTALALAIVIGAAIGTSLVGLSPAFGAFLGGVLLADSEYRHELETNIEPFKGLLLGLFFTSVGMSIAFNVVREQTLTVAALLVVLIGIKIGVLYVLATLARMHVADRVLMAVLLSQAGEFAFVVLQVGRTAGIVQPGDFDLLTVIVALSMATTPLLLFVFDRLVAPRLSSRAAPPTYDAVPGGKKVIVLGYGRFGQIVTRLLRSQGFEMTLIDDDPAQIATVRRFGVKVFYGDGERLDILRAAGAAEAEMILITTAGRTRITNIAALVKRHFPQAKVAARAVDRSHAHDLMDLGVEVIERETFRSALALGAKALVALGRDGEQAERLAGAFQRHDEQLLADSYPLRGDEDAYIGFVRQSVEMLSDVLEADLRREAAAPADAVQTAVDKPGGGSTE